MSLGEIRVELELDDGKFTVRTIRAGGAVREMGREFDRASKSVKNIENSVTGFLPKLRDIAITASILKGGLMNLYSATLGWQKAIIDTNAQVERMTFLLSGMSTAATEAGRFEEAADDVRYLFDQAERAPFSLSEMTNALVKFRSVGIDGAREGMEALVDSVAQFGGTDETLHRATIAIQQMAGKGVISMEELRQQLGEAVPTAINLMARSMNMTYQELVDAVSTGTVKAQDALQRMFREMERTMGGSAERMMDTWGGMVSRLETRWMKLKVSIGDNGMFLEAKEGLQLLIDTLDEAKIQQWGQVWGEVLANSISAITAATRFIIDHGSEIVEVTKNLAILLAAWKGLTIATAIITRITAAVSAWRAAMLASAAAAAVVKRDAMGVALSVQAIDASAKKATISMRTLWSAALGPIGLIVGGIAAVALAFVDLSSDVDKATDIMRNNTMALDEATQSALRSAAATKTQRLEEAKLRLAYTEKQIKSGKGSNGILNTVREEREEVERLQQEIADITKRLDDGITKQKEYAANARVEVVERALAKETAGVNATYSAQMKDLVDEYEKKKVLGLMSEKDFAEKRLVIITDSYQKQLTIIETMMTKINEKASMENLSPVDEAALDAQLAALNKRYQDVSDLMTDEKLNALRSADLMQKIANPSGKNSKLDNVLANAKAKVAELTAELEGGETVAARFMSQLENGVFGNEGRALLLNTSRLREFIVVLEEQARIEEALVARRREIEESQRAQTEIQERLAESAQELNSALNFLTTGQDTSFIDKLNSEFDELLKLIPQTSDEYAKFAALVEQAKSNAVNVEGLSIANDFAEDARRINNSLLTDRDRMWREYLDKDRAAQEKLATIQAMSGEERKMAEKAYYDYLDALRAEYDRNSETQMQSMLRDWSDVTKQMENATANWLDDATDRLVDFAKTGKLEFGSMIESMLSDLLKMQIQAQMADIFGGAGSSKAMGSAIASGAGKAWGWLTNLFADGGIMTGNGSVPLRKYANGGIAKSPQLAMFGEGSMNEAYVPLPDGRTIPVTMSGDGMGGQAPQVQVNVINQTSQEVNANQGQMKFDGKKMILDVVMTAAATPGPFRDSLKGAMR